MAEFVSTRGASVEADGSTAVIRRACDDGGILVPELPTVGYADLCEKGYAERAEVILGAFFGLKADCEKAYSQFDDDPTTVIKLDDNLFIAELWHGATRTASDITRCVLPEFIGLTGGNNCKAATCGKSDLITIAALTVCYYSAYCDLVNNGEIKGGDLIDFVLPASCLEYLMSGWYARRMGLPVNRLVCACDTDDALYDFIDTGVFDTALDGNKPKAELAENIERFIYDVGGGNAELTCERMKELDATGRFSLTPDEIENVRDIIAADCVDGETADEAIFDLFDEYGYVADKQTASAYAAAAEREFVRPTVVLSIDDPFLSAPEVMRALGEKSGPLDDLLDRMEELTAMECHEFIRIRN